MWLTLNNLHTYKYATTIPNKHEHANMQCAAHRSLCMHKCTLARLVAFATAARRNFFKKIPPPKPTGDLFENNQSINQSIDQSTIKTINPMPNKKSNNQSIIDQSVNQSIN